MDILKVTNLNFENEVLKCEKTVLIDFFAEWCGPCKRIAPILEQIAKEKEDIKIVKINVDDSQELAIRYQVMSIPTLVVVKNGEEKNRLVGLADKSEILGIIE